MNQYDFVILGAGMSGIGAAYKLSQVHCNYALLEKRTSWGGICDNFTINGFRFDKFIHLSFSTNALVNKLFLSNNHYKHLPEAYNFFKSLWLKHPVQANLFPLSKEEKDKIIKSFKETSGYNKDYVAPKNYKKWLYNQFGEYFSNTFPLKYTKKYWTVSAEHLETKWIGKRVYTPSLEEMQRSCHQPCEQNRYYAKEMRYPKKGGYKAFLNNIVTSLNINCNSKVVAINLKDQFVLLENGNQVYYKKLISSIPLPEYGKLIDDCPDEVKKACEGLAWTSGVLVSVGFNKPEIPKHLWFYIYDDEIMASRVYSPSLKSKDNVPNGCSSVQAEIYFSKKYKPLDMSLEEIKNKTLSDLSNIMEFDQKKDVEVIDVRYEPYANVIFDHGIYENRNIIKKFLKKNHIFPIGRYGEWAYLWSDQSFLSGVNLVEGLLCSQ